MTGPVAVRHGVLCGHDASAPAIGPDEERVATTISWNSGRDVAGPVREADPRWDERA
ncbi:hypothetical protein [Lentzea waywayandensis]|uniref:hypothetical protein n=1 Tax=Lentzea waywayandensis TaxID=84724 RepID=UPI0015A594E7|nr:hypothetical protein [Lentzea waywayandensis]